VGEKPLLTFSQLWSLLCNMSEVCFSRLLRAAASCFVRGCSGWVDCSEGKSTSSDFSDFNVLITFRYMKHLLLHSEMVTQYIVIETLISLSVMSVSFRSTMRSEYNYYPPTLNVLKFTSISNISPFRMMSMPLQIIIFACYLISTPLSKVLKTWSKFSKEFNLLVLYYQKWIPLLVGISVATNLRHPHHQYESPMFWNHWYNVGLRAQFEASWYDRDQHP
jgi:hypothetical protein